MSHYKITGNCFHKRVLFAPDIEKGQKGVRIYSELTAAFLKCFGKKIEKITTHKGKVLHLDSKSLDKWVKKNSAYLTDSPTLTSDKIATICQNFKKQSDAPVKEPEGNSFESIEHAIDNNDETSLLKMFPPQLTKEFIQSKFHPAVIKGHLPVLEILKELGANIERENQDGLTSYQLAILNRQPKILDWHFQNGSEANILNLMLGFHHNTKPIPGFNVFYPDYETLKIFVARALKANKVNNLDIALRRFDDSSGVIKDRKIENWPISFYIRVMIYFGMQCDGKCESYKNYPALEKMVKDAYQLREKVLKEDLLSKIGQDLLPKDLAKIVVDYTVDPDEKLSPEKLEEIANLCIEKEKEMNSTKTLLLRIGFKDVSPIQAQMDQDKKILKFGHFRTIHHLKQEGLLGWTSPAHADFEARFDKDPVEIDRSCETAEKLFNLIADYSFGDPNKEVAPQEIQEARQVYPLPVRNITLLDDTPEIVFETITDYLKDDLKKALS